MASSCQLCGEPNPIARRDHGLDLCEPCGAGYLAGRLQAIGVELAVEEVEVTDPRGKRPPRLVLHVVARMPQMLPLYAYFARMTLLEKIRHRFDAHRFVSGDRLLDARVAISSRTPELLRPLLANDGLQSAIMSLVASCEAFEIQPGLVDVRAPLEELDVRADVPLAVAAMLRHIAAAR